MPFYEVIYETGAHSVLEAPTDDEAFVGVRVHHERALKGELGGASGTNHPAERVVKVLKYEKHPVDYYEDQAVSKEVAESELKAALEASTTDGVTDLRQLAAAIREISNVHDDAAIEESRQNSMYKAKEVKTFTEKDWS